MKQWLTSYISSSCRGNCGMVVVKLLSEQWLWNTGCRIMVVKLLLEQWLWSSGCGIVVVNLLLEHWLWSSGGGLTNYEAVVKEI